MHGGPQLPGPRPASDRSTARLIWPIARPWLAWAEALAALMVTPVQR
jgi:hypothetical protein